jgi:hypothetical protein
VSTRAIRTSTPQLACDVCGRTLLRGERAEIYLAGAARHSVCELCTSRALHGGWVREGTVPDYGETGDRVDRRRSLLRRRRRSRGAEAVGLAGEAPPPFGPVPVPGREPPPPLGLAESEPPLDPDSASAPAPDWPEPPVRSSRRGRGRRPAARPDGAPPRDGDPVRSIREPRHVHAVPTSVEHKVEAALELFNSSEHPRTVAGITRSLGLPDVSVHPPTPVAAIVNVVVAWELCWYRYEIDLSEEVPAVRGAGQGYELSELTELERLPNVTADERGGLSAGAPPR